MQNPQSDPAPLSAPPRRLPLYLLGTLLFIAGPVIYFIQFRMNRLVVPWYAPILATVGVVLILIAVMQRGGVIRIAVLVLLTLLCGLEWFFLVVGAKSPTYQGPAQAGHQLPPFVTTLADGKPFTNKDLETGTATALVFFRGRW